MILESMLTLAAAASPCAPAAGAPEIVVPLKYVSYDEFGGERATPRLTGYHFLEGSYDPPEGNWKLPALSSAYPLYGVMKLGDGEVLFVLDKVNEKRGFYDRLYCDRNGNGDLTDDEAVRSQESNSLNSFSTSPFDLELSVAGKRFPYRLSFRAYSRITFSRAGATETRHDPENLRIYAMSYCGYSGELELDGESYRVHLGDKLLNGRFDDATTPASEITLDPEQAVYQSGDLIWVGTGSGERRDSCPLGNRLWVGGRLFSMEVDFPAKRMTLRPFDGPVAKLSLPGKVDRLLLSVGDGGDHLIAHRPDETIEVPAGECRLLWYQIYAEDDEGDDWFLSASATPRTASVPAAAGTTVALSLGEPFCPGATLAESEYESFAEDGELGDVRIRFHITGRANERVTDLRHLGGSATRIALDGDDRRPMEPTYAIVDEEGKRVASGSFRYG